MRKSIGFLPTLVLGLASAIVSIGPGRAAAITYTEETTATGSLDGVAFTDASVVLTMHNDTTNVVGLPPMQGGNTFMNTGTMTVSVGGGPSETFTDPDMNVAVVQFVFDGFIPSVNFNDGSVNILEALNRTFSTYDLKTSIGPIMGGTLFSFGVAFPTSSGLFVINNAGGVTGVTTFTATVVPEPSSWILLAMGFAGLGLLYRRDLLRGSAAG
jgi:PEP-CTERM motif